MAQPKGRPTPKRSEARAARRTNAVVPAKGRSSSSPKSARQALKEGDERNYPSIARGPERALVRDVVDARRSFGWLAMPGWAFGAALSLIPTVPTRAAASIVFPVLIGVVVADSIGAARAVRRAVAERYPNGTENPVKSLVWYGVARNTQFRRRRLPRPRVRPGESF